MHTQKSVAWCQETFMCIFFKPLSKSSHVRVRKWPLYLPNLLYFSHCRSRTLIAAPAALEGFP